jgi:hypothetical protein
MLLLDQDFGRSAGLSTVPLNPPLPGAPLNRLEPTGFLG